MEKPNIEDFKKGLADLETALTTLTELGNHLRAAEAHAADSGRDPETDDYTVFACSKSTLIVIVEAFNVIGSLAVSVIESGRLRVAAADVADEMKGEKVH